MKKLPALLIALAVPFVTGASCSRLQAKSALKDGNKQYKEENFKRAIEFYERAVERDPGYAEAWFYLGSSHQALYRPGKEGAENKEHLEKAIEAYNKSLETNPRHTENQMKVRLNTLGALTGIYSEEPHRDFAIAYKHAQDLIADNPDDVRNLYAMANLFEKFEKIDEAEKTYERIRNETDKAYRQVAGNGPPPPAPAADASPSPAYHALDQARKGCAALAGFYNKPLWNGRSKFDQAIDVLLSCAALDPNNAEGYLKVAQFYWDKSYRDPMLNDEQKREYADKGLEAVEKGLQIKPDYFEAVIFKGLLYRVKATVEQNPRLRTQYLEEAATLQKQGLELKKQQAGAETPTAPAPKQGS